MNIDADSDRARHSAQNKIKKPKKKSQVRAEKSPT
jgi:hypothetical protein